MTFSIIGRDTKTGEIGIAVASRFFACGSVVPYVSAQAGFASQAFINPLWGMDSLVRLNAGDTAATVLADLIAKDEGQANRQAHMIAPNGDIAQHTGASCVPWAGHRCGTDVSCAGNMLTGPEVVDAMMQAWTNSAESTLAERLMAAMEAGEAAGGDKRGRQAAALTIHDGQAYPALDLRVDDHADPLVELRRLIAVSKERYAIFRTAMPTRENFSGWLDRGPLDAAIAAKEEQVARDGVVSASHASDPT